MGYNSKNLDLMPEPSRVAPFTLLKQNIFASAVTFFPEDLR